MMQYHENFLKQTIISRYIMEAKIIVLDINTSEAEFLKNLLCDLSLLNNPWKFVLLKLYWFSFHFIFFGLWLL